MVSGACDEEAIDLAFRGACTEEIAGDGVEVTLTGSCIRTAAFSLLEAKVDCLGESSSSRPSPSSFSTTMVGVLKTS